MTEKQQEVVHAAKVRLQDKPWFRGVCIDALPHDDEIIKDFDGCVQSLVLDTMYWEDIL